MAKSVRFAVPPSARGHGRATASTAGRRLDPVAAKRMTHAVTVEDYQRRIFDVQRTLAAGAVNMPAMVEAAVALRPSDYDGVVTERQLGGYCGYPYCAHAVASQNQRAAERRGHSYRDAPRFKLDVRRRTIIDRAVLEQFCSRQCYDASMFFRGQLSDLAVYMRTADDKACLRRVVVLPADHSEGSAPRPEQEDVPGEKHRPEAEPGQGGQDTWPAAVALGRGPRAVDATMADVAAAAQQMGCLTVSERARPTVEAPTPDQAGLAAATAVEGYVPSRTATGADGPWTSAVAPGGNVQDAFKDELSCWCTRQTVAWLTSDDGAQAAVVAGAAGPSSAADANGKVSMPLSWPLVHGQRQAQVRRSVFVEMMERTYGLVLPLLGLDRAMVHNDVAALVRTFNLGKGISHMPPVACVLALVVLIDVLRRHRPHMRHVLHAADVVAVAADIGVSASDFAAYTGRFPAASAGDGRRLH